MVFRHWLKLIILMGCSAFFIKAHGQKQEKGDMSPLKLIKAHRKKENAKMKSSASPLPESERKKFKGLKYYPIDLAYRVNARFVKTENPVLFKMKTTTDRLPNYTKYAEVHFTLGGVDYKLEVYQTPELMKVKGYEDYLFIPFTDATNGDETYEVGRYLEMRIPDGEDVVLDFNLSYSPYCSYNSKYSCPIPPEVNHIPVSIKAGEKKYTDK
jgi:uncharacterized protein